MADNENINLKELAKAAAHGEILPEDPEPVNEEPKVSIPEVEEENIFTPVENVNPLIGEPQIIAAPVQPEAAILMSTNTPKEISPLNVGLSEDVLETPNVTNEETSAKITEEDFAKLEYTEEGTFSEGQLELIENYLKDIPITDREKIATPIFDSVSSEIVLLTTKVHLSVKDAQKTCYERILKELQEANQKYKDEHPELATVVIDKSQEINDLGLTAEEHAKLEKVKKVRLVLLEDVDLSTIEIEHPSEEHKVDYIKSIEGSLSKYSVPLPMLGDFMSFKGAQIVQMISLIRYDDAKLDEVINLKASLIYDKMIGSSILKKYGDDGNLEMNYVEFSNKFPYQDIDLAIFGILCASTLEESSTTLTCECGKTWDQKYNIKSLLKLDDLNDYYKARVDTILANKSNSEKLVELYNERKKVKRYKSPFTSNIYDLSYPSVARAINILKRIDENDTVMAYNAAIALYINQILIYNGKTGKYVSVKAEETATLLETFKTLADTDLQLLANLIKDEMFYNIHFVLEAKCPSCKKEISDELGIDNLIFMKAQDSMVQIEA